MTQLPVTYCLDSYVLHNKSHQISYVLHNIRCRSITTSIMSTSPGCCKQVLEVFHLWWSTTFRVGVFPFPEPHSMDSYHRPRVGKDRGERRSKRVCHLKLPPIGSCHIMSWIATFNFFISLFSEEWCPSHLAVPIVQLTSVQSCKLSSPGCSLVPSVPGVWGLT
jgi:hypothetical protein